MSTDRSAQPQLAPHVVRLRRPTDHELTLIIPAYNEEQRLRPTLETLTGFLDRQGIDYRVVVVDDGSSDGTAHVSDDFGPRCSTLRLPENQGKGAAVRQGLLAATGRIVGFTDADLPYDLNNLITAYRILDREECEVVFGARDLNGAAQLAPRKLTRRIATTVFSKIVATLISREVTDTQCGLKLFSRAAAYDIFSLASVNGFAFDVEVVFLTQHLRIPFKRIPVTLVNEYSTTLSLTRHSIPMLLDAVKVWGRHLCRPAIHRQSTIEKPAVTVPAETRQRRSA
ncbi:MAG: glycosyltransferase [Planctomycetes bacterium]|nr:glycosyltransferase [Planctomycetota bacterium]